MYLLHLADGSDVGEAIYPQQIKPGEELFFGGGRRQTAPNTGVVESLLRLPSRFRHRRQR